MAVTYTSTELITVITAIGGLIILTGGVITNIILAWSTARKVEKQGEASVARAIVTTEKLDAVGEKTRAIEHATNGMASESKAIIAQQEIQLTMLRETIAEQKRTAQLLAQAAAAPTASQVTHTTPLPVAVVNTANTPVPVKQHDET